MSHLTSKSPYVYLPQSSRNLSIREVTLSPAQKTLPAHLIQQVADAFIAKLTPADMARFNGRLERGLEMAKKGAVLSADEETAPRRFYVLSSDAQKEYIVDLDAKTCTCPDSLKGYTCKHRVAAYYFEQASKLIEVEKAKVVIPPQPKAPPELQPAKTEEQLLKEMGFAPAAPKPVETKRVREPGYTLGALYRRYLRGTDLAGEIFTVTIEDITKEKVMPHPTQPAIEKWCLTVSGLPVGMPYRILFGVRGEEDLVAIFGNVRIEAIKGKAIAIYPKVMNVAGQSKVSIRFRSAA